MITSLNQLDTTQTYSYSDYLSWKFTELVELIKGKIFPMSAPLRYHQKISIRMASRMETFLSNQNCGCEVYAAPFDVRFPTNPDGNNDKEIYTVVQPDISVICDLKKLDERGCVGAPDWIIEILSESTTKKDKITKYDLYQEFGVKEYWIVFPKEKVVETWVLEAGKYKLLNIYNENENVSPSIFPNLVLKLNEIFE